MIDDLIRLENSMFKWSEMVQQGAKATMHIA